MKTFVVLGSLTLFIPNAYAGTQVRGDQARKIIEALNGVGAFQLNYPYGIGARIEVSDVNAGTSLTSRGLMGHVELYDKIEKKMVKFDDPSRDDRKPALDLVDALKAAGVKEESRPGGSSLEPVSSIFCGIETNVPGPGPASYSCTIN